MTRLPEGTLSGHFAPISEVSSGNIVVVQEFGSNGELRSNQDIIHRVTDDSALAGLPKIVSHSLVDSFERHNLGPTIVSKFEGPSAKGTNENTGTFGELTQYTHFAQANPEHDRPIFVSRVTILVI